MTLEEFEAENNKAWLQNKQSMQGNATSINAEAALNKNGVFGSARGAVEFAHDPLKSLIGIPTPAPANPLGSIAGTTIDAMDKVDRAAKNWRQNRAAGNGIVGSAVVVGGTALADETGVTGVSNAFARHEAVNAEREQTITERVIGGVVGAVELFGTAVGIVGVGGAAAGKASGVKAKLPGPKSLNPGVIEAELAEPVVAAKNAASEVTDATNNARIGAKRGPKTDINAPHNAKIRSEAQKLIGEGNELMAGGGGKEQLIRTPGGKKSGRRPDILYRTPNGEIRGRNIGKTYTDGSPIKRELDALNDLINFGKIFMDFIPYDR